MWNEFIFFPSWEKLGKRKEGVGMQAGAVVTTRGGGGVREKGLGDSRVVTWGLVALVGCFVLSHYAVLFYVLPCM